MASKKIDSFQQRIQHLQEEAKILKSKSSYISIFRLIIFVTFVVVFFYLANARIIDGMIGSAIIYFVVFGLLVRKHNAVKSKLELLNKKIEINGDEIKRLKFDFEGIDGGKDFLDEKHEYSGDLDLFGRSSLFQLLSRCGTFRGKKLIANWLACPADKNEIESRQNESMELSSMLDWRQDLQAYSNLDKSDEKEEKLFFEWLKGEDVIRKSLFYQIIPYLLITISCFVIGGYFAKMLPISFFIFPFFITGPVLLKVLKYSQETYSLTNSGIQRLTAMERCLLLLENNDYKDPRLRVLRSKIVNEKFRSSDSIIKLRKIFERLNLRGNVIYILINAYTLTDLIFLYQAEKWRSMYKKDIDTWIEAIAEFEALSSIASYSFANDTFVYPEISEETFIIKGSQVGHPLIHNKNRVCNDFDLSGRGEVCMITGSNMAGKSTFLRTIGVNAVLAHAGAPVCASSFSISVFQVFTSMRTKDNLEENISSFYAELIRLRMLLQTIGDKKPVMFFLDEILKGTNSVDRHIGAESLAIQLSKMNAFGMISTHDLKLGELKLNKKDVINFHFSSDIIDDEIRFDYILHPGICQSTNASALMAKMGIEIL